MREPGASQASRGNQRHRKIILNGGWPTIINKIIYMYPPNAVYVATGAPASGLRKHWSMPKRYSSSHNSDEYFKYWSHTPCTQALRGRRAGLSTRLFKYMKSLRQNLMIQVMIDTIMLDSVDPLCPGAITEVTVLLHKHCLNTGM